MKHFLLQKLISQLLNCCVDIKSKEGESVQLTQRKIHYSMDSLSSWYMTVTQKTDPKMPSKKRTTSSQWQCPPVVVILKDMESFATKVLQDFIIINISSLLCIELFQVLSCKEHLTMVLNKLLLTTQFPFKINEKALQLSLLEHFYSQPLGVLCCNLPEAKRRINFLSNNQWENMRHLPSFRRYIEKQVALLTNERCLKEETQLLLENLQVYHRNYFPVLRCLHKFTSSLPKYPQELYRTCLEKNIRNSEEYLLKMLANDELMTILEECFKVFKSSCENHLGSTAKRIEKFLAQFQSFDETKEEEDGLQKTDLYHLQKSLLEMKESSRSKKQTKFEVLRENIVNFMTV
uniref:Origin recognition complex subunit 3 n=1 Tax=Mandrillus leucophaeus TaxID=9568 RepID=A0A2K5ZVM1_MANLE